jgi:hypothetical protein
MVVEVEAIPFIIKLGCLSLRYLPEYKMCKISKSFVTFMILISDMGLIRGVCESIHPEAA